MARSAALPITWSTSAKFQACISLPPATSPILYPDATTQKGATAEDLKALASRLVAAKGGVDYQVIGQTSFSAADQFELLLRAVGDVMEHGNPVFPMQAQGLFGPDAAPPSSGTLQLRWPAFRAAAKDALNFVQTQHRIPARVFIGADPVAPGRLPGQLGLGL